MASQLGPLTAVVTGATSGVGRAVAQRLAAEGGRVALLARGQDGLAGAAADVSAAGGVALPVPTDVADPTQVEEAGDRAEAELGPVDLWVNNAMTTVFSRFVDTDPDEFRRATEVTYLGAVWGTRTALRLMTERDRGTIIQVGSALAYRGIPLQAAYCGAKHALKGFTESVRTELLHAGSEIHIGMVQLPAVNTPQFSHCRSRFDRHPMPVPPIYQPEVAASAVALAVAQRRRAVFVGWPTVKKILGNRISSAALDHYLARSGFESQLSDLPPDPDNRVGNLFDPVGGDPGTHGIFDDGARQASPVLWASRNRGALAAAAGAAGVLGAWLAAR